VTILVTGGLGHIGSKLIQELSVKNRVLVIDSLETQRYSSIFHLAGKNNIEFIEGDVSEIGPSELAPYHPIFTIIHLAAKNHGQFSKSINFSDNALLTRSVIRIAEYYSSHLIFPSSSSVYSQTSGIHQETMTLNSPTNSYSAVKLEEEEMITSAELKKWTILRLGTIYGVSPGMRFHTAVNKFCWESQTRGYIEVWNNALGEIRPYLSIQDCVRAFTFFIENTNIENGIWNLATGHHKTLEILELIQEFSKNKFDIRILDYNTDSVLNIVLSLEKLFKTGFTTTGSLRNDIRATIEILSGIN